MRLIIKAILILLFISIPDLMPERITILLQLIILFFVSALLIIIILACKDLNLFHFPKSSKTNSQKSSDHDGFNHISYNGINVHYTLGLNGGGILLAYEFIRLVSQKIGKVHHIFEYCAGPGFIGFSLLANNLCDKLTLADINPAAVNAVRETIKANGLQDRVTVYQSDCLNSIPQNEQWDLVVSNPPWHIRAHNKRNLILSDPGNRIHKSFFQNIHKFLKPNGSILFVESHEYTKIKNFKDPVDSNKLAIAQYFPPVPFFQILRDLHEYKKVSKVIAIFLRFGLWFREVYFMHIKPA